MVQIALGWNADKSLPQGINDLKSVTVAGWHKTNGRWDNLGNSAVEGTLDEGWVTSNSFNANDYEIFSLGSFFDYKSKEPDNYFMSPNGDGINDFFVIEIYLNNPPTTVLKYSTGKVYWSMKRKTIKTISAVIPIKSPIKIT